jgi:hypothetical protein
LGTIKLSFIKKFKQYNLRLKSLRFS